MVPYRGAAPALQVLVAGQIDILFDQASKALPQLRANNVKAYAVTAKDPLPAAPEISTVDAAGLPGFYMAVWHGLWAPKGTQADIIAKLNAAAVDALADTNVRARLAAWARSFPRWISRPRRRSACSKKRRSRNGGRSSNWTTSEQNEQPSPAARQASSSLSSPVTPACAHSETPSSRMFQASSADRLVEAGHSAKSDERPILALPNDGNVRFSNPGHASPQQM
jgi:Tripartite tricarboxylate transporter family receptor